MRSDMSKIIVERPRRGSWLRSVKFAARVSPRSEVEDFDLAPPRDLDQKELNENLAPLKRTSISRSDGHGTKYTRRFERILTRGKPRNCTSCSTSATYVQTHCRMDGRTVMATHRWSGAGPVEGLYVHPKTGLLRRAPKRKRDRRPKPVTRVPLSELAHYELIEGVWLLF